MAHGKPRRKGPQSWILFLILFLALGGSLGASNVFGQTFLEQLEQRLKLNPPATEREEPIDRESADQEPGYLGLVGDDYGQREGVTVLRVRAGSPAETAGLQAGDRIVSVGDSDVRSLDSLATILSEKRAGETLTFGVVRNGQASRISATLERKRQPAVTERAPAANRPVPRPAARLQLGITAETLTDAQRLQMRLAVRRGVLVTSVQSNSPADQAGLEPGMVIVEANRRRIDTFPDLQAVMQRAVAGESLELKCYDRANRQVRVTIEFSPPTPQPSGPIVREFRRRGETAPERFAPPAGALGSRRPLLGRIGQLVGELADAAQDPQPGGRPVLPPNDPSFDPSGIYEPPVEPPRAERAGDEPGREAEMLREMDLMRREVELLRRQVELLQDRLERLEATR